MEGLDARKTHKCHQINFVLLLLLFHLTELSQYTFHDTKTILDFRGALGVNLNPARPGPTRPGPANPGFDPTRQYVGLIHYVKIFSTNQCLNLPDIE